MRRDSSRYGNFPKRQKSRERPWNRASPAFGKLWEHAGKCRVDLSYYEDFIFNWIAADHIYKKRASFVLIAASTIHDKSMTKETLDIYLKLVYENSCYEHDHIKKAVSWALREIGKTDFEYAEKVLLTAYDLLASGNKVQIWIAKDVIKELETVVKVKERKRLITSNSKMGRER